MRRFAHLILLFLVFCTGLVAGSWFSIEERAETFAAGVDQRLAEKPKATPAPSSLQQQSKRAFDSEEDMLTAIMSAVSEGEPLLRAHRLHDLLGNLSSAEIAVLFERTVRVEDRERRDVLLAALLNRWAALDPAAAAEAVRPYRDRFRTNGGGDWRGLESAVHRAWAHAFPDTALAEAMAAPDAPWAQQAAWTAIRSLAEGDSARQLDALARMPASRLRDRMCEDVIKTLAAKDSAAAEARLDLITEPRRRTRLRAEVLGKLAERDPSAALSRLSELAPDLTPSEGTTQLMSNVLRGAGKKDPDAALAAVAGLPEELRRQALGATLVGWSEQNPADALAWGAANGVDLSEAKASLSFGDSGGSSWQTLLSVAFDSDRAKTLAWLRTQPASAERDTLLRAGIWSGSKDERLQIYAELTPRGQVQAAREIVNAYQTVATEFEPWVKSLPPGAARQAAIQGLATAQARVAPDRIDSLADAWPAGPDREAVMRGIATSLNYSDPRRALDFARRVTTPAAREATFEHIARSWFFRDQPAARAWVTSAPELSSEQKRVLLRGFDDQ